VVELKEEREGGELCGWEGQRVECLHFYERCHNI
jgi:hypothetical protein